MAEIQRGRQSEHGPLTPCPAGSVRRLASQDWLHDATTDRIWDEAEFPAAQFPAGQTAAERIKALLDWAGFGTPEPPAVVETCGFRITDPDGTVVFICTEPPHPETPHMHAMYDGHAGVLNRGTHWPEGR